MEETLEQEIPLQEEAQPGLDSPESAPEEGADAGLDSEVANVMLGELFVRSVAFTSLSIISLSILGAAAWRVGLILKRLAYVIPF